VIDAAGAIYVIGGGYFQDVWVSTNGGARPDLVRVMGGYTKGVLPGTKGYKGVLQGYSGVLRGAGRGGTQGF
jgi:hypothetical protein